MTRYSFGGEITHTVATVGTANVLILAPSATVTFYDSEGGAAVTDFVLWNTSTGAYDITSTSVTTTTGGTLPRFQGPDGLTQLWAQDGGGAWLRLRSYDATGGGVDTTAVHKTGDETVGGVKTFTDGIAIPDGDLGIAATAGLQTALDNATSGGSSVSSDPIGGTLGLRRSGATMAVATAVQADEATPLAQVQALVGDIRELETLTDKTATDATTWVTLDDLAITNAATGQEFSTEYNIVYEASAAGGIAFRFSIGSPGLTVVGWTVRGRMMGAKLAPTLTTTPATSEDYGRRLAIRYGSSINSDTNTNPTISGTFGGLGAGIPTDLWVTLKFKVVGAGITNGLIRPEFRQKGTGDATPTLLPAHQSTATLVRIA